MDNLKCKKGEAANENNDLFPKVRGKIKKKRKSKGKENYKKLKRAPKSNIREDPGRVRIKGRRGMEGMFFKGLRSEYISRECLNEANEARKKEDLNKIIDMGRAFLDRRRFASTCEGYGGDSGARTTELNLEEELEKFSEKYEETVEAQVLARLPEEGVLEDALKALRDLRIRRRAEAKEFKESDMHFFNELQFLNEDFEAGVPAEAEHLIPDTVSPGGIFISENFDDDGFMEESFDGMLIMTDWELENYQHPSFDKENVNDIFQFQGKNYESPTKELNVTTPPIQFFRRNMF